MKSQTWCFVCVEAKAGHRKKCFEKMLVNYSGLLQVRALGIFGFTSRGGRYFPCILPDRNSEIFSVK